MFKSVQGLFYSASCVCFIIYKIRKSGLPRIIFLLILKYNSNFRCNTQKTEDVTIFYRRSDIFKDFFFPSTITYTSHIPSTITLFGPVKILVWIG